MANGVSQWPGKAARWTFWRLPRGAARYTWNSNLALANDIVRRTAVFLVYGAYLWGFRWVCVRVFPSGHIVRTASGVLLLIWFLHGLNLLRWIIHARTSAARERAWRREQAAWMEELREDVRQTRANIANRLPGGTFTMMGSMRHHDPADGEARRVNAEQQRYARDILGDDQEGVPLGDRFEPMFRLPRFRRRKRGDQ